MRRILFAAQTRGSEVINGYLAAEHQESFGTSLISLGHRRHPECPRPPSQQVPCHGVCRIGGQNSSAARFIVHLFEPEPVRHH